MSGKNLVDTSGPHDNVIIVCLISRLAGRMSSRGSDVFSRVGVLLAGRSASRGSECFSRVGSVRTRVTRPDPTRDV